MVNVKPPSVYGELTNVVVVPEWASDSKVVTSAHDVAAVPNNEEKPSSTLTSSLHDFKTLMLTMYLL